VLLLSGVLDIASSTIMLYHNALTRNPSILIQVENSICVSSQDEIEKQ
jgi:hypothetical protein